MDHSNLSKEELIKIIDFLNGRIKVYEIGAQKLQSNENTNYRMDDAELYWKQIIDSIPVTVLLHDTISYRWMNKYGTVLSGYTSDEWLKMTDEERSLLLEFEQKPETIIFYEMFTKEGKKPEDNFVELEYKIKRKDGEWIWVYSTNTYIFNPAKADYEVLTAIIDITDRKNKEIEIERLNTELEEAIIRERKLSEEKNALMQKEIDDKNRELNRLAIYLTEKNNCLLSLKKQASALSKAGAKELKKMTADIIDSIDQKLNSEAVWNTFEIQFESMNPHFMKNLINIYSELTQMELRVCSLIKLNLSSKAISTILNTSSRTVDTHRLNIRKKMNLNEKEQLTKLLNSL